VQRVLVMLPYKLSNRKVLRRGANVFVYWEVKSVLCDPNCQELVGAATRML
jgi:hypothetical protein